MSKHWKEHCRKKNIFVCSAIYVTVTRNILLLTAVKKTSLINVKLTVSCTVSFSILTTIFSRWTWVSRYQNVYSLDFAGAKDDRGGGDNCSCKMCKAPVKSSPATNQHPVFFYRPDALPVAQPTVSEHWREKHWRETQSVALSYLINFYLVEWDDGYYLIYIAVSKWKCVRWQLQEVDFSFNPLTDMSGLRGIHSLKVWISFFLLIFLQLISATGFANCYLAVYLLTLCLSSNFLKTDL